jgi:hypothetical protein
MVFSVRECSGENRKKTVMDTVVGTIPHSLLLDHCTMKSSTNVKYTEGPKGTLCMYCR